MRLIDAERLRSAVERNFHADSAYLPQEFLDEIDGIETVQIESIVMAWMEQKIEELKGDRYEN